MPRLEQTIDAVFSDRDITPSDVPQLDLYMDQVRSRCSTARYPRASVRRATSC